MRDKIAEIIKVLALGNYGGHVINSPAVADAIIAALPDMVKPLEWRNHPDGSHASAIGLNGILYISTSGGWRTMHGDFHKTASGKAACNAHHVAQVLSAFGIEGDG